MTTRTKCLLALSALPLCALAAEGGWATGFDLTLEASAGISGAARHGESLHNMALGHAEWESAEKDGGLHGHFYVSALSLLGRGPTERYLGDFLAASNTEGYESLRLYSWWFEAGRAGWSLRAGALLADEEFGGTDGGGNFLNSAFGWPAFISANTLNTGPAFFVAAPGVRFERTWGGTAAWRVGLYDGDAFDSPAGDPAITRHGLHYRAGGDQGWFVITEAVFAPGAGATRLKAGAWLHTATFTDVADATREHGSNHGAYAIAEHTLAGQPGDAGHVEFFARAGFSPTDRNAVGWAFDTGLAWTGPLPGRPADVLALGLAHARFGSPFADAARLADPAAPAPDFEQAIEASYTFTFSDHVSVQPDLQYIRHPGGSTARRDALVFLLRLNLSY